MTSDTLHDQDFLTWTERQAEALRQASLAGSNFPIDWERVAEEIEDLGSEKIEKVESLLHAILVHLVLISASPAEGPRRKWRIEVDEFRHQIERILRRNPSIRPKIPEMVESEMASALRLAGRRLREYGEIDQARPVLNLFQVSPIRLDEAMTEGCFPEPGSRAFLRSAE